MGPILSLLHSPIGRVGNCLQPNNWYDVSDYRRTAYEGENTYLLQSMQRQQSLFLVILDELDKVWQETVKISDGDVASCESCGTPNIFFCSTKVLDGREKWFFLIGEVARNSRKFRATNLVK